MCNTCNMGYTTSATSSGCPYQNYGCGCNSCCCPFLSWLFGGCYGCQTQTQSVCRDCNGCLRIVNRSNGSTCGCGCGCARQTATTNDTSTTNNGNTNGLFGCYSVCGRIGSGVLNATAGTDSYYARQYGLNGCGTNYNSYRCGCN